MLTNGFPLVAWTERGLFCAKGDFYIDPSRAVDHAVVTHAHSDHARRGSQNYYCESTGVGLLKARLGKHIQARGIPYGEPFRLGDVQVSFHSVGHILGSAQVRIQSGAEVWVVSGDYKREPDPSCEPFEVVRCDTFITEATFGTPKYVWNRRSGSRLDEPGPEGRGFPRLHQGQDYGKQIYDWWQQNAQGGPPHGGLRGGKAGKNSLLYGYSLGKAQRILALLAPYSLPQPVVIYETMVELTECYRQEGRQFSRDPTFADVSPYGGDPGAAHFSASRDFEIGFSRASGRIRNRVCLGMDGRGELWFWRFAFVRPSVCYLRSRGLE